MARGSREPFEVALPCPTCGAEVAIRWPPTGAAKPPGRLVARCRACGACAYVLARGDDGMNRIQPCGAGPYGALQPDRTPRQRSASTKRSMSPSRRPASAPRFRLGPSSSPARRRASSAERHRASSAERHRLHHDFAHHGDYDDLDPHSRHHYHDQFHMAMDTQAASMLLREFAACLFNRFPDTETAFSAFDTNRTGQLSMHEFQAGAEALHFPGSASAVFWELDIGRMGVLTRREFASLQRWSPLPSKAQAVTMLARQTFSATFEGITRDRTPFAIFRVTKCHEYERPSRTGDKEYLPGSEFVVSLNEATRDISEKIMSLAQGDSVSITYEHNSVRVGAGRRGHSERIITQLSVLGSKDSELLARQIFTATFEGIRPGPESASRVYPPKAPQPIAVFRVEKSLEYEKINRYGDKPYAAGSQFMLSLNEATPDIQDVIRSLRPGDSVRIAFQHNFVGIAENRHAERIVTHLSIEGVQVCEMLATQTFIAVFEGIRAGPKLPSESQLARPPSPVAFFKVVKSLHYEKPGMYGDKEYIEGMEFLMDLNKASPDIRAKVKDLMPGASVRITYQHSYVGSSINKYPERVVVELVPDELVHLHEPKAPEVLAQQMFTAVFEGIKPGPLPTTTTSHHGLSGMSAKPHSRHSSSRIATFKVSRSLHYEKPGAHGDKEYTEGAGFSFDVNTAPLDIQDKVQMLAQGALVKITYQHQLVDVNGSKHPERLVTELSTTWQHGGPHLRHHPAPELLARQVFSAKFEGIRPGPESGPSTSPAKPPAPLAVFRVAKSHEYDRPSSYGDKEYLEGSEFMLDLNQASPEIRDTIMAMSQGAAVRITYQHNFVEGKDGGRIAERCVTHLIVTSDSPADIFLTRQTLSATFEGIRPGQDPARKGHRFSSAPVKPPVPVAAFRVTESHRYEKKGTGGDNEYMPGSEFLINLNEATTDIREKVMALHLSTPVRFTYQQNSSTGSKPVEKVVTQFTVLSQAEHKRASLLGAQEVSKAALKSTTLGPAWTRGEMEPPNGERDMGGWRERFYTHEQQSRLGVDEHGRHHAQAKESKAGSLWTYGETERPAGERYMGVLGWPESFYTAEQQQRLHVDEHGRHQAYEDMGPTWVRGELEPPAGLRDRGSWSERVYTEEQQRRLGVDELGKPNMGYTASRAPSGPLVHRDNKYMPDMYAPGYSGQGVGKLAHQRLLKGNSGIGVAAALDSWGEWHTWKDGDLPASPRIARWNGTTTQFA